MARQVELVAPQLLISQAVAEALRGKGLDVMVAPVHRVVPGAPGPPVEVALMLIDEPSTAAAAQRTMALVGGRPGRVLVLIEQTGPRLGQALLAAGAAAVLPTTTSLQEVVDALETLAGGGALLDGDERNWLVGDWYRFLRDMRFARDCLAALSPRERLVLREMDSGVPVSVIAARLDVAETTVRSQVKSVLRKLGVGSQLAAVALVRRLESPLVAGALGTSPGRADCGDAGAD